MNRMYEIGEGRPIWKLRPTLLLVTAGLLVLVATGMLALVVSGPLVDAIGSALGLGSVAITVWSIVKWPLLLVVAVLAVALLYWATPNVRQPKFRWISIGALVALVLWALLSVVFGFYVSNFSSYDKTYGSLAGVIIFLLWLWLTNLALLFGAELDAELERGRQLQAGIEAEEFVQLPARDTRKIDKAKTQHETDASVVEKLRESRAGPTENTVRMARKASRTVTPTVTTTVTTTEVPLREQSGGCQSRQRPRPRKPPPLQSELAGACRRR